MAKKLSPIEQKASLKALGDYRGEAQKLMKDKMKNVKKVTVASNSDQGIQDGLEKAQDLLKGNPAWSSENANKNFEDRDPSEYESDDDDMESDSDFGHDSEHEHSSPEEGMSEEELNSKIKELLALQAKKKSVHR